MIPYLLYPRRTKVVVAFFDLIIINIFIKTKLFFFFLEIGKQLTKILERLKKNIDSYCVGEIKFPDIEMAVLTKCSNSDCQEKWQLTSQEILLKMRRRPNKESEELEALNCSKCGIQTTCTNRINTALEHGYLRCYKKSRPSKEEVLNLIWLG